MHRSEAVDRPGSRAPHVFALATGITTVPMAAVVLATLAPSLGLVGLLLSACAAAGCVFAVKGMRAEPRRHGLLALALTVVPGLVTVLACGFLVLMFLMLGGGNPNS